MQDYELIHAQNLESELAPETLDVLPRTAAPTTTNKCIVSEPFQGFLQVYASISLHSEPVQIPTSPAFAERFPHVNVLSYLILQPVLWV